MENYTNTRKGTIKSNRLSHSINQFLNVKKTKRTLFDIFLWWEQKRIVFNLFILALCFFCFKIQKVITGTSHAELFTERQLLIFVILYNIVYSSFCVLEFFLKKNRRYAPHVFKNALFICTSIITIPTVFQILETIIFQIRIH